jgi:predicted phosphodiesterase
MRILCIADIHGHASALLEVLAFGKSQGCTVVLAAGDLCFPGPSPLETWKLLMHANAHCVQGISDLAIATIDADDLPINDAEHEVRVQRLRETQKELGETILAQLERLPPTFRMSLEDGGELILVHGSPVDPTTSITHDMDDDEVMALLGDEAADVVVCGGGHVPFERYVEPTRVISVGSVGESPTPGVAHAAILDTSSAGIDVRLVQLALSEGARTIQGTDEEKPKEPRGSWV